MGPQTGVVLPHRRIAVAYEAGAAFRRPLRFVAPTTWSSRLAAGPGAFVFVTSPTRGFTRGCRNSRAGTDTTTP
jgi:hypothetical protein